MKYIKLAIFVLISCLLLMPSFKFVWAEITDLINATVKISICGNGIIEGGEDCEGDDLGGATCESLGYGPGTLSCDIACSFDTSGCSPAPTPTPTSTPTPTLTPTPTSAASAASAPAATSTSGPTATSIPNPTATPIPTPVCILPPKVFNYFDPNKDCRIEMSELFETMKIFVGFWRDYVKEVYAVGLGEVGKPKECDFNGDKTCNLVDLSILLYYIGR